MIKDLIGRIVEAERRAEQIENDAYQLAARIELDAAAFSQTLKTTPSDEAKKEADQIVQHAKLEAEKNAAVRLKEFGDGTVSEQAIARATTAIVQAFLSGGLGLK